jgi:hypothetical protein
MVHRVAYLVKAYNVLTSLVIIKHGSNRDSPCTYRWGKNMEKKGSKDIHVLGVENKRQIIVVVSSTTNGSSLLLQVIFTRSIKRCLL